MSRQNVELVRRMFAALSDGVVPLDVIAPDYVIQNIETAVTDKTYRGAQGALEWVQDLYEGIGDGARIEVERIIADRDDFVIARLAALGSGARSGIPLRLAWIATIWFRDGRAVRGVGYTSRAEALKAVGLED